MSAKECGKHHHRHRHFYRCCGCSILVLIFLILLTILIIFLVLRPSKPSFSLQDTSVLQFNLSSDSGVLSSVIQVTISSHNPNDKIGIYYDTLDAFASYKGQQITAATQLPPGYQGHHDVVLWSPFLYGQAVPLAPSLAAGVAQDLNAGVILVYVKIDGELRWKVGSWMSSHYHITANCPAFLLIDSAGKFKFHQTSSCTVDV